MKQAMKQTIAALFLLLSATAAHPCEVAQFTFNCLVPARGRSQGGTCIVDESHSVYTWYQTGTLPYQVPSGYYLGIADAHFASKYVNSGGKTRSSYMVIENVFTVTELGPSLSLRQPFVVPSGGILNVTFWNNSPETQWMNGFITGQISTDPLFRDCR